MANKRMFSLKIVDSDAFLEMPMTSQLLYFHLAMRADDEGFLGNPKRITRMIGANEDDLKLLIAKRFIIAFESGVVVIKHWLIHNTIRMDRFNPTTYQKEKDILMLKENMSYTENCNQDNLLELPRKNKPNWLKNREKAMSESDLPYSFNYKIKNAFVGKRCPICGVKMRNQLMSKNCIPTIKHNIPLSKGGKHELGNISVICSNCNSSIRNNETEELNSKEVIEVWNAIGNQSQPQVKLSKVKLSKVNLIKDNNIKEPPYQEIFNFWNENKITQHRTLTEKMKTKIRSSLKTYSLEEIKQSIKTYGEVLNGEQYYWNYKWTLDEFLARGLTKFLEVPTDNFLKAGFNKEPKAKFLQGRRLIEKFGELRFADEPDKIINWEFYNKSEIEER